MNKIILITLIILLILFSGCSQDNNINKTSELCSIMKNSIKDNNSEVFMDGNICVIGDKNWEKT